MTTLTPDHFLRTLKKALIGAGRVMTRYHQKGFRIAKKGPVDLVTTADRQADRLVRSLLRETYPQHSVITEESPAHKGSSPFAWYVDPIDGTTNFAHGLPHASVSIGLEKDGRMLLGGVYDPFRQEMFLALRGKGAHLNGRRLRVSKTKTMKDSLLVTGFPYDRREKASFYLAYERFLSLTQGIRRFGSAALDLAYVAAGRYDGYWEYRLNAWDVSAGWLMVEEAGGKVTNFFNQPYTLKDLSHTLATNGHIHPAMARDLKKAARVLGSGEGKNSR